MALDLVTIGASFYARLASASAGTPARAALGSTASVIHAPKLKRYDTANVMPARVLCAYRGGEVSGNGRDGNRMTFRWWVYDDPPNDDYRRINAVIPLLIALYPEDAFSSCYLRYNGCTQESEDDALHLICRTMTWTAYNRQ
jgi:hypothetical protein